MKLKVTVQQVSVVVQERVSLRRLEEALAGWQRHYQIQPEDLFLGGHVLLGSNGEVITSRPSRATRNGYYRVVTARGESLLHGNKEVIIHLENNPNVTRAMFRPNTVNSV